MKKEQKEKEEKRKQERRKFIKLQREIREPKNKIETTNEGNKKGKRKETSIILFCKIQQTYYALPLCFKTKPQGCNDEKNLVIFLKHLCSLSRRDDM